MKIQAWSQLLGRLFSRARGKSSLRRRAAHRSGQSSCGPCVEALESRALLAVTASLVGTPGALTLEVKLTADNDHARISYNSFGMIRVESVGISGSTVVKDFNNTQNINRVRVLDANSSNPTQKVTFGGGTAGWSSPISGTGVYASGLSGGVTVSGIETIDVNRLIRGSVVGSTPVPATVSGDAAVVNLGYTAPNIQQGATSIQQAVDFAGIGGRVNLPQGSFVEQTVFINKRLTLDGWGSSTPGLFGGTRITSSKGTVITLGPNASGTASSLTTIQDLYLDGNSTNTGVALAPFATVNNVCVSNVAMTKFQTGFFIPPTSRSSNLQIKQNLLECIAAPIWVVKSLGLPRLVNAVFADNIFRDNVSGLVLGSVSDTTISGGLIEANGTASDSPYGINLDLADGDYGSITISGVTFRNNGLGDGEGGALRVATNSATLAGLTLVSNTFTADPGTAAWGLVTSGTLPEISLASNTFDANLAGYVLNRGSAPVTVAGASLGGTTVDASTTKSQLFAIADKIVDAVDVAGYGPVVLKPGEWFTTPNSWYFAGETYEASVQRVVSLASAGDTIRIQAGAYNGEVAAIDAENLTLDAEADVSGVRLQLAAANTLTLTGAGDVEVLGNANANLIIGNEGRNAVTPGGGADTLLLGSGDDTVLYDSPEDATGDVIDGGTGDNQILFTSTTAGQTLVLPNLTGVYRASLATATGDTSGTTPLNIDASGVTDGIILVGNDGANILTGGAGDDTLEGNGGDDTIRPGSGSDLLKGGKGKNYVEKLAGCPPNTSLQPFYYKPHKKWIYTCQVDELVMDCVQTLNLKYPNNTHYWWMVDRLHCDPFDPVGVSIGSAVFAAKLGSASDSNFVVVSPEAFDEDVVVANPVGVFGNHSEVDGGYDVIRGVDESIVAGRVIITAAADFDGFWLTKRENSTGGPIDFTNWEGVNLEIEGGGVARNLVIEAFGATGSFATAGFVRLGNGGGTLQSSKVVAGTGYSAMVDERGVAAVAVGGTAGTYTVADNLLQVSTNNAAAVTISGGVDNTVVIAGNTISGVDSGIAAYGVSPTTGFDSLTITNNTIGDYNEHGIRVFNHAKTTPATVTITGNSVLGPNPLLVDTNSLLHYVIGGAPAAPLTTSAQLRGLIADNFISEVTAQYQVGFALQNFLIDGITVQEARVGNDADNIFIGGASSELLQGNGGNDVLTGGAGNDYLSGGTGNNVLEGGSGLDTALFDGLSSDYTLSFGDGHLLVTRIDGSGSDSLTGVESLRFNDRTVRVVGSDSQWTTIQSAIDAASAGDVVMIAPGTYVESVTVDKPVTLQITGEVQVVGNLSIPSAPGCPPVCPPGPVIIIITGPCPYAPDPPCYFATSPVLTVTGDVVLSGATLSVAATGEYLAPTARLPLITAGGTMTGTGDIVDEQEVTLVGYDFRYDLTPSEIALRVKTQIGVVASNMVYDGGEYDLATFDITPSGGTATAEPLDSVSLLATYFVSDGVGGWTALAGPPTLVGSYKVAVTYAGSSNFTSATAEASFDITSRVLTVVATATSRVYDGTDAATVTLSDDRNAGEDLTLTYTLAMFDNRNVGTGKTVTVTGLSLSGFDAPNYTLAATAITTTAEITAASITVTAQPQTRTYDGTANSSVAPVRTGTIFSGDSVSTEATQTFDTRNVGTDKTLTPSGLLIDDGNLGNNYAVSYVTDTTGAITSKNITGTFTTLHKTYDSTTAATIDTRSLVGVESGDSSTVSLTGGFGTFSNANVGNSKTVNAGELEGWSLSGADAGNYTLSSVANSTANITPRILTVTAKASNKTYDRTTATSATLTTDELPLDVGTVTVNSSGANFVDANAGDGKTVNVTGVTMSGVGSGNYQLSSTTVSTTANITPVGLTLLFAVASSKTYDGGSAATVTGSSLSGILGDDNVTVTSVTATYDNKNVGTNKPVTATGVLVGAEAGNYSITSVTPRTASITAKPVTATFMAGNKTYDGTAAATILGSTIIGQIMGETVSLAGTATFSDRNVGVGKTVSVASPTLTGADKDNYTLTGTVPPTTGNITLRTVTPVFNPDNKLYDGTAAATLTFVSDDRVSGDAGAAKLGYTYTASFASSEIGTWTVSVTDITPVGTEAANYVVNSTTQSLSAEILPIPNNPPEVETTLGETTYTRLQPGVIIDAGITVTDSDSSDFDTGFLVVSIDNRAAGDVLAISSQGTGAGQISVTGTSVFYEGVQIGSITLDGTGSNDLKVTFNAAANAVNAQALARRVTFANTLTTPDTTTRTIRFAVNDGDGGTSSGVTKDVAVLLGNMPVVITTAGSVTYTESTVSGPNPPIFVDTGMTVTDADSTSFNGGSFTASFAANGTADDRLSIKQGFTADTINVSGTTVQYITSTLALIPIGTVNTNTGGGVGTTPLVVTLNANATPAHVQVLARSIQFQNVSNAPSILDRSVSFVVNDGDAGPSIAGLKTVKVVGTNDRATLSGIPTAATYNRGSVANPNALIAAPTGVPSDPDGTGWSSATPLAFFNCGMRVRITSGGNSLDRLGISNALGVTFTGTSAGDILVSGVKIGTYTLAQGASANLTVTFLNDGSATQARIQALTRSVTFSTTRATMSGTLNLRYEIGEGVPLAYSNASNVTITLAP